MGPGLSEFRAIARLGIIDADCHELTKPELFQWQYLNQLMGRYDDVRLADLSDMTERQDFNKPRLKQDGSGAIEKATCPTHVITHQNCRATTGTTRKRV